MSKIMYKDGITRTIEDSDFEKFKDLGFREVVSKIDDEIEKERKIESSKKSKNYD